MDRHGLIWIDGDSSEMRQPTLDSGLSLGNSFKQVALHRITHEDVNREWCIYAIITCTYMYSCIYTHFILYTSVHKSTYDKHVFFSGRTASNSFTSRTCLPHGGWGWDLPCELRPWIYKFCNLAMDNSPYNSGCVFVFQWQHPVMDGMLR